MGPRNLLILFFSTVAVSLVILIILFSLFFKNIDFNFNTKLPSSAPELNNNAFKNAPNLPTSSTMSPDSKAEGISRSTVNVPPEVKEEPLAPSNNRNTNKGQSVDDNVPRPPVSDDSILDDPPSSPPQQQGLPTLPPTPQKSSSSSSASQSSAPPPPSYNSGQSLRNTWGPSSSSSQRSRQSAPVPPLREAEPAPSSGGPPVPGQ